MKLACLLQSKDFGEYTEHAIEFSYKIRTV